MRGDACQGSVHRTKYLYNAFVAGGNALQFAIELARIAQDYKSENLIALDLRGINAVTDFTVIGTGTSERQIRAVAEQVIEYGKRIGQKPYGYCGFENAAWVIVDFVDVVFHLFAKPYRDYYDLELLWGDAPRIVWARSETA
jgi:ribosome-associated protein